MHLLNKVLNSKIIHHSTPFVHTEKKTVLWSQIIKEKKQKTNTFDVYYFSPQNISYCKEIPCNQQQAHNNVGIILCILYFSKFKYFLIIILIL